jgi:hypothetical protein
MYCSALISMSQVTRLYAANICHHQALGLHAVGQMLVVHVAVTWDQTVAETTHLEHNLRGPRHKQVF